MIETSFTPFASFIGGALIGLASVLLMLFQGRIAGVSGILSRLLARQKDGEMIGRLAFVSGLILAPAVAYMTTSSWPVPQIAATIPVLVIAGLLVGFGSVWGSGCTSGHGICGLSRLSIRSLVAVATFMTTAMAATFVVRHLL